MRIKHFFGLAVLAAMTASCSSNNDLVNGGNGENETGSSYASITINLPTTSGTRAENDNFNEGTASEYAVNDATLVIFEKGTATSENNFAFVETADLGNLEPWKKDNTTDNGITTETTITAKLEQATVGDGENCDYYALVILNNKDKNNADKVTLPTSTTTYGKWNVAASATAANLVDNTKGFYMANAPEFTTADAEPTTLVKIEGIYRTKEEAQSKPGTTVHVERGLAKVTVGPSGTIDYFAEGGANATGTNYSSDKVTITNWALDVTNKHSFPVHVTSGLKDGTTISEGQNVTGYADIWKNEKATAGTTPATSRFVSNSTTATFKRVYWGIDPNYSMGLTDLDKCKEQFTIAKTNGEVTWNNGSGSNNPLYCLENTFDIKNMKQGQTTRVLLKATYAPSALASETDKTFFMIGNSSDIWTTKTLKAQIASKAKEALGKTTELTVVLKGDLLTAGTHVLTESNVSIKEGETKPELVDDGLVAKLNNKLGLDATKKIGIKTYEKGESYYIARIKHFGDDLTPWVAGNENYGENNLNWLGRYGVLRNNWYELTVNSISGPGYPDVPEVKPDVPDDEDTKYINVSVKILDWAKRSQSLDL
jgi:hypothetical protein